MSGILCSLSEKPILSGFLGIIIIFTVYVLLLAGYSALRKRFAKNGGKFGAELITLGLVVIIGVGINLWILLQFSEETTPFPAVLFRAIYQAIGSFAFEGLAIEPNGSVGRVLISLFYGWPILTGVTFVSIITAKANYEWFSKVRILIRCIFSKSDIFIFTAINEETLEIAESLNERGKMIIFSGPKLPAFDGKDELCRRVVKNSFYYYSYRENKDSKKPLIRRLGLHLTTWLFRENTEKPAKRRVVIFSFDSEKQIPKEEENLSFVFDDAKKLLTFLPSNKRRHLKCDTVEYYILSKREKNYQAYQGKLNALKTEFGYDKCKKTRFFPVSVTVWGEANAVADTAAKAVHNVVADGSNAGWEEALCGKDVRVWSLGFGTNAQAIVKNLYVHTARMYPVQQEGEEKQNQEQEQKPQQEQPPIKYAPNTFRAEAFSPDADTTGAFLSYESPFSVYLQANIKTSSDTPPPSEEELKKKFEEINKIINKKTNAIKKAFKDGASKMLDAAITAPSKLFVKYEIKIQHPDDNEKAINEISDLPVDEKITEDVKEEVKQAVENRMWAQEVKGNCLDNNWDDTELSPLTVCMHKESCVDFDFLDQLDAVTGKNTSILARPQFIVIATGDDYQNIRLTNALVYDILRETNAEPSTGATPAPKQMLIVNLRDQKNAALFNSQYTDPIETYTKDGYSIIKVNDDLIIAIVGMNTYLYSKDVIEYNDLSTYAYNYDKATGKKTIPETVEECFLQDLGEKWPGLLDAIDNAVLTPTEDKYYKESILKTWRNMGQWDKESNQSAHLFFSVFKREQNSIHDTPQKAIPAMLTEHQRWMRLHFVNGWIPGKKDKPKKVHDCLVPYNMVSRGTYKYDLINVLWKTPAPPPAETTPVKKKRCCPFRRNKEKKQ